MVSRAVLLVGGDPSRHRSAAAPGGGPVALAPVANRLLLAHALDSLKQTGVRDVAILVDPTIEEDVRQAVTQALAADRELDFEVAYLEDRSGGPPAMSLATVREFVGDEPFALHLCDSVSRASLSTVLATDPLGSLDALLVTYDGPTGIPDTVIDLAVQRFAESAAVARRRYQQVYTSLDTRSFRPSIPQEGAPSTSLG